MPDLPVPQEVGEQVIAQALLLRMHNENSLIAGEREAVAYRIAEFMVSAKDLYTQYLPRLLNGSGSEMSMEDEISGLRMAFLHLRDLVSDFDNAFLEAMFNERKAEPGQVYHDWAGESEDDDDEWTAEDLGEDEIEE